MKQQSNAGASLLSALVGVAIVGILAAVSSQFLKNTFGATKSVELRGDVEGIRRTVLNRVSCSKTIAQTPPPTCDGHTLIKVLDSTGNVASPVISARGTSFGPWTVVATCDAAGLVYAQIGRLKPTAAAAWSNPDADFYNDPLTNKALSWTYMRPFFFASGVSLCDVQSPAKACVLRSRSISSSTSCVSAVSCQPGETVLAGGCTNQGCSVSTSRPNGNGWACAGWQDWTLCPGFNGSPCYYHSFKSTAFATCCK